MPARTVGEIRYPEDSPVKNIITVARLVANRPHSPSLVMLAECGWL